MSSVAVMNYLKACYVLMIKGKPNPHPFMMKHSYVYYSINDCP